MFLETSRVLLREVAEKDEDHLFDLNSDPEVMRYLTNGRTSSRAEVQAVIQRYLALQSRHKHRFGLGVATEKKSGLFMGTFLFRPCWKDLENTRRIELGYRLKQAFWGQNYATEVAAALMAQGFHEPGVEEVFAITMKSNLGSQAVMRKAGLVLVREFLNEDEPEWEGLSVEYAIGREQYQRTHPRLLKSSPIDQIQNRIEF